MTYPLSMTFESRFLFTQWQKMIMHVIDYFVSDGTVYRIVLLPDENSLMIPHFLLVDDNQGKCYSIRMDGAEYIPYGKYNCIGLDFETLFSLMNCLRGKGLGNQSSDSTWSIMLDSWNSDVECWRVENKSDYLVNYNQPIPNYLELV